VHLQCSNNKLTTATTQFGFLNVTQMSVFLVSSKAPIRHVQSSFLVILLGLLLCGDTNPAPALFLLPTMYAHRTFAPVFLNTATYNIRPKGRHVFDIMKYIGLNS